jgi:hypothetical protein
VFDKQSNRWWLSIMAPDVSIKRSHEDGLNGGAKRVKSTNGAQPQSSGFEEDLTRLTQEIKEADGKFE